MWLALVLSESSWQSSFKASSDISRMSAGFCQQEIEKRVYKEQILVLRARRNAADMQLEGLLWGWEMKFGSKYTGLEGDVEE